MRVMTLNVWNYTRPWPARREMIAELIQNEQPDAVALQETRHDWRFDGGRGQGEQLAALTGYHPTSAVAQVYVPILRVDEGLTILTREPPVETAVCRLTVHPHDRRDENHRICLAATLQHHGSSVHIFNTHFSLSPQARLANAAEVAQFVRARAGVSPAVLMGDLNALPASPEIRFLRGAADCEAQSGDFVDCWAVAHPDAHGYTYASFDPVRRIDFVLARNLPGGPISAHLVGDESRDGVYPSDHLGIVVDLPL